MTPLRRIEGLTLLGRVESPNTSEALLVQDGTGTVWVYKAREKIGREGVLAEGLCFHLARHLGAKVPEGAIGELDGFGAGWLSCFLPAALDFDVDERIRNLEDVGAVLALDVLTCNEDRHADNLLRVVEAGGTVAVFGIDWDRAAISRPDRLSDYGVAGVLNPGALPPGLDLGSFEQRAISAAGHLQRLSGAELEAMAADANLHAGLPAGLVTACLELLAARLACAPSAVGQFFRLARAR